MTNDGPVLWTEEQRQQMHDYLESNEVQALWAMVEVLSKLPPEDREHAMDNFMQMGVIG